MNGPARTPHRGGGSPAEKQRRWNRPTPDADLDDATWLAASRIMFEVYGEDGVWGYAGGAE